MEKMDNPELKEIQESGYDDEKTKEMVDGQVDTTAVPTESPEARTEKIEELKKEVESKMTESTPEPEQQESAGEMSLEDALNYQHEDFRKGFKEKMMHANPEKIMKRAKKIFEEREKNSGPRTQEYLKLMNSGDTERALKYAEAIHDFTFPKWDEEKRKYKDGSTGGAAGSMTVGM